MTKNLAFYFFYDKDGIVDEYVFYYLEKLSEVFNEICFISNGSISEHYFNKLNKLCTKIIIRQNEGMDAWAYKEALEHYGFESLKEYSCVLLNNFTCYGPIYPFKQMFDKVNSVNCDFWGHCEYRSKEFSICKQTNTTIYPHLMSYFIVFNSQILKSDYFKLYWDLLPEIKSYEDSVGLHESQLTRFFSLRGFNYLSFMNINNYSSFKNGNIPVYNAYGSLILEKNPLLKRKAFEVDSDGHWKWKQDLDVSPFLLLDFIKKNTDYPVNLIKENLRRTYFSKFDKLNKKLSKI